MSQLLNASSTTAGPLFASSRFVVPEYQREYAWGLQEVADFWADLKAALDGDTYFMGLLIFTREEGVRHVVDGQQRLLTLTLLADALRRTSTQLGRRALTERIESTFLYAMNYDSDAVEPRLQLTDRAGNTTLRAALKAGDDPELVVTTDVSSEDSASLSVSDRILASQRYLFTQLGKDLAENDSFKRLGQWSEFILEKLYFAVFEHPDRNAAYKVFEVVNTRGKELTTADLVKSYVLSESGPALREANYRRWIALTDKFKGGYETQFVQYIRHIITERHGYVLPSDLYKFISERYVGNNGVDRLLEELTVQLSTYEQIMDPTSGGLQENRALQVFAAMDLLGLRTVRPMLLALSESSEPVAGMIELLKLVVRRIVVGNFGTGSVERRFSDAAKAVFDSPDHTWQVGLDLLSDLNPSESDFQNRLEERAFNKDVLAFLRSSISQQTVTPVVDGHLHFVRPRVVSDWAGFSDEDFRVVGSTLGNTFLSTLDRRPKGSNTLAGYNAQLLPTAVDYEPLKARGALAKWSEADVRREGAELAERGADIWYD